MSVAKINQGRTVRPRRPIWWVVVWWMVALGMMLLVAGCTPAGDFVPVTMTADEAVVNSDSARIHYIPLVASNAYFIETDQGLILVDAGLPFEEGAILRRMEDLGWDTLCLIYITHAHIDHFGSAAALRSATDAPIAVHAADAADLAEGRTRLGSVRNWTWTEAPLPLVESLLKIAATEPDILLEDGDPVTACGLDAQVVHTPGHTPGSSTLLVEGKYAFVGDLVSTTGDPHAQGSYALDWSQLAESLDKVRDQAPTLVFPGHGSEAVVHETFQELEVEIAAGE